MLAPGDLVREREAGADGRPVHEHGAGAAGATAADDLRARQSQAIAKRAHERDPGLDRELVNRAVDLQLEGRRSRTHAARFRRRGLRSGPGGDRAHESAPNQISTCESAPVSVTVAHSPTSSQIIRPRRAGGSDLATRCGTDAPTRGCPAPGASGGWSLRLSVAREESAKGVALLGRGAPHEAARTFRQGGRLPALDRGGERRVDIGEGTAAFGGRQDVEESDPGEKGVMAARGRRRRRYPSGELPAAGRRHPVKKSRGPPPRSEGPEKDPAVPPEPGQGGVDLRDAGAPRRRELRLERPGEVVARARLRVKQSEEHVRERHAITISI